MKLSDYVALFLHNYGIKHIYVVVGGANLHLIDSFSRQKGLEYICAQHEQGAAIMADASARLMGLSVACATSGPGATNMLTGALCAYDDSIPVLFLTGQVSTHRLKGDLGVRQLGFQEADTVDIFKSVTKYAVCVHDKNSIRYELEKAMHIALSGRQGPVLVDIPDNLQREDIGDPNMLPSYYAADSKISISMTQILEITQALRLAQRPVLILGLGVRLSGASNKVQTFIEQLNIPVILTWGALDLLSSDHPLLVGTFGTHGSRTGNFAIQNADFIISIGSRLDTHHTGILATFARAAKIAMVDIDHTEIEKFTTHKRKIDFPVIGDASNFIEFMLTNYKQDTTPSDCALWKQQILHWKKSLNNYKNDANEEFPVSPYEIVERLSDYMKGSEQFFIDTGCSLAWFMQAFKGKADQRVITAFNCTPMGYALPAAIGGALVNPAAPTYCITGDGGFQMNIQELATCIYHKLPIKIILFQNRGYSMIKQTQEQWLDNKYCASSFESGIPSPNFIAIAKAYGFDTFKITEKQVIDDVLQKVIENQNPTLCVVEVSEDFRVNPQLKYGFPLEDQEPHLPRKLFLESMLIEPLEASLQIKD